MRPYLVQVVEGNTTGSTWILWMVLIMFKSRVEAF